MKNRGLFLTIIIGVGGLLFFMLLGVGYRYLSESSAPDDDTLYDYDDYDNYDDYDDLGDISRFQEDDPDDYDEMFN